MPLVNHTYNNLAQGVSQQHSEARFESQVTEMVNCVPHISSGIYRRNPATTLQSITDTLVEATPPFTYTYDRGTDNERYLFVINNGDWEITNVDTGDVYSGSSTYLDFNGYSPSTLQAVTVADYTFITNGSITPALTTTLDGVEGSNYAKAVYWIKQTTQLEVSSTTKGPDASNTVTTSEYEGFSYTLNGQTVKAERTYDSNQDLVTDRLTAPQIALQLATQLGSNYAVLDSFVYWVGTGNPTSWEWSDTAGNQASQGFNGVIEDAATLPAVMPNAFIGYKVYVTGGSDDNIGYWLEYTETGWTESIAPGMYNTIDTATMPHVFIRSADGSFTFTTYDWASRTVGDLSTIKNPSFIGNPITDIFFYSNRLGFISNDSVILSEVSKYNNFWATSARAFPESDPIDVSVASQEVSILRYAVETVGSLILFADNVQYSLASIQGPLSPASVYISVVSRYTFNPTVKPRAIGNEIFFISSVEGNSHLYSYTYSDTTVSKLVATDVTIHTPTYLPSNINTIIGHSILGYIFMYSEDTPDTIYVFNNAKIGSDVIQASLHKWVLPLDTIRGIGILANNLIIASYNNTTTTGRSSYITLSQPTTLEETTYLDFTDTPYESYIEFSKWEVKDGNKLGTMRGRLQIRTLQYSLDPTSYYATAIVNTDIQNLNNDWLIKTGVWSDTDLWCDACGWNDAGWVYDRVYRNTDKITVLGNNNNTKIIFRTDPDNPSKGFKLHTLNFEGYFHQRSQRY